MQKSNGNKSKLFYSSQTAMTQNPQKAAKLDKQLQ